MVRKKQEELSGMARVLEQLKKNSKSEYYSAGSISKTFRYIDFIDPRYRRPVISLEWLFGSRGLLAGRVMKLQAAYGAGKSSFMFFAYACGQINHKAWCMHIETEAAAPPEDFIASYGCDPNELLIGQPKSLEESFNSIEEFIANIRGGLGGSISDAGRPIKTKYTEPIDAEMLNPIAVGYDSISGLGEAAHTDLDIVDLEKGGAISKTSRIVSQWFRERNQRLKDTQTLLMMSAQEKANIQMGGMAGRGGPEKTTIANAPIGFHATWILNMKNFKLKDDAGNDIGEKVNIFTEKNKLSDKHRSQDLYLVRNQGFDLQRSDTEFLLSHPTTEWLGARRHSHGISCALLSDKSFKSDADFLNAFYGNTDLLNSAREKLRVRGFGFKFETDYMNFNKPGEEPDGTDGVTLEEAAENEEKAD